MSAPEAAVGAQAEVIALPVTARVFVLAGPGAGKTWTLLQRAEQLATRDEVRADEVLVLSFTRAVVGELRRRQSETTGIGRLFPETFDAFASRLLSRHAEVEVRGSFDARIDHATALVESGAADETLTPIRHVFVDEVQDLVGPRARFVSAVLGRLDGGFTAFGDPAQAIYDHQRVTESDDFIGDLGRLAEREILLDGNHRAGADLARDVEVVRERLLAEGALERPSDDMFAACETLGDFEGLAGLVSSFQGRTGVLCRDNATALALSDLLHEGAVPHRVRRSASDRPVAGWVAAAVGRSPRVARGQLDSRIEALRSGQLPVPGPEEAWRQLQRLDRGARQQAARASVVADALRSGRVPPELTEEPDARIVISTVHRAKGLEFDNCVIVDWARRDEDVELDQRLLFVALSRARRFVYYASRPQHRTRWYREKGRGGRLFKRGRSPWQTFGIEAFGGDVHAPDPGGVFGIDLDPDELQGRLMNEVRPDDVLDLERVDDQDYGTGDLPCYAVHHESGVIGVTGVAFGTDLVRRTKGAAPARITSIRVEGMETVAGTAEASDAAGLGAAGLWLRPRLVGLGEFEWEKTV